VVVDGATLAYRERGEGRTVVFVHGSASDLRTWEQQVPAIAESHRAIAYSRRYARPNGDIAPGVDDQMSPHVDDLVAFLRAIDAAPAHLVGHSRGAFICLLTAIRQPRWSGAWCSRSRPCCRFE
jgi:pimeloyl-ACP methyl ester carboxylesterase